MQCHGLVTILRGCIGLVSYIMCTLHSPGLVLVLRYGHYWSLLLETKPQIAEGEMVIFLVLAYNPYLQLEKQVLFPHFILAEWQCP